MLNRKIKNKKLYIITWIVSFIVLYSVLVYAYINFSMTARGIEIWFPQRKQADYGSFLVEKNQGFLDLMVSFDDIVSQEDIRLCEQTEESIHRNLKEKNQIIKTLRRIPPSEENYAYLSVYHDMINVYAFYIQGEVMKLEYLYKKEAGGDVSNSELFFLGEQMCNLMGNSVLDMFDILQAIEEE